MGKKGYWKEEGYYIKPMSSIDDVKDGYDWTILMMGPNGERCGYLRVYFDRRLPSIRVSFVSVDEDHRRKGICTALYDYAEMVTNKKMIPASDVSSDPDDFSEDAAQFWNSRN